MSYKDVEILKAKKQLAEMDKQVQSEENMEKENQESIEDGMVHIYGEEVVFQRRDVSELNISIIMPKEFETLPEDTKKILYPLGNRPSHIFASEEVHFTLGFNHTGNEVPNSRMKEFVPMAKKLMEKLGPKTKIIRTETTTKNERNIGRLEFVSQAVEAVVYNMMSFISIDEKLFIATISFPNKYKKRYVTLGNQIMDSFEVLEKEE
jgi:hypothetical protein